MFGLITDATHDSKDYAIDFAKDFKHAQSGKKLLERDGIHVYFIFAVKSEITRMDGSIVKEEEVIYNF